MVLITVFFFGMPVNEGIFACLVLIFFMLLSINSNISLSEK